MNILRGIETELLKNHFKIISRDLDRPWGGFLVIDEDQSKKFINLFFNESISKSISFSLKISPKILLIRPSKRLSWQYHNRRSEIWSVIQGNILISKSVTDIEENLICLEKGDQIKIDKKIRHRIIGREDFALVAEIWIHTDKSNPSNENDIVRLQDDFNRN